MTKKETKCDNCGDIFLKYFPPKRNPKYNYCSNECKNTHSPKSIKRDIPCDNCGQIFCKRIIIGKESKLNYCSNKCRNLDKRSRQSEWDDKRKQKYSVQNSGENNPNYENKWTEEKKHNLSIVKIKQYEENPELAKECGKANRGKKRSEKSIKKQAETRKQRIYDPLIHTDKIKLLIGSKSSAKFTEEYKKEHRKTMEERGYWKPLSEKSEYDIFYKKSNWIKNIILYLNDEYRHLLESRGVFSFKNKNGIVRDHILGRKQSYEMGLPYFIVRHPANLQILEHSENIKKGFTDVKLSKEILIEKRNELFDKIKEYKIFYPEQELCIEYIEGTY